MSTLEGVYPESKLFAWSEHLKKRGLKDGALGYGAIMAENGYVTIAADCTVTSPLALDLKEVRRRYGILGGRGENFEVFRQPGKHIIESSSMPDFFGKALAD